LIKRDQSSMANDLERRQQGEQFQVLDPANLPDRPSFPNKQLFALGGFGAGLGAAISLVLLIEILDTSLHSKQSVENVLQLPVLATIPVIQGPSNKRVRELAVGLKM
jgi:capsular polysaccharide biosynthesis protein